MLRKCKICNENKKTEEFRKSQHNKTGYCGVCRECYNRRCRELRKINLEQWKKQRDRNFNNYRILKGIDLDLPRKRNKNGDGNINHHGYHQFRGKEWEGHPCADKYGRVLEHRLVMYNHLGRPLKEGENIHHKNGIRSDNRVENLELWTTKHPPGQRVHDMIKWCIEFLKEYGHNII